MGPLILGLASHNLLSDSLVIHPTFFLISDETYEYMKFDGLVLLGFIFEFLF